MERTLSCGNPRGRFGACPACCVLCGHGNGFCGPAVLYQAHIFYVNKGIDTERLQIYAASKGQDVIVPPFLDVNKYFFVGFHIKDLQNSTEVNGLIARFYDLKSVKTP